MFDDYTGEYKEEWVDTSYTAYEDLGTHRAKCSLCGHVMYYSEAARRVFENDGATENDIEVVNG